MTVHHLIRWIIEPTNATIIRCTFLELNQSQHVSGIIMPRRTRTRLVITSCEDAWLCWLWLCGSFPKVHTAYTTAPHDHSQHKQASSHEVLTRLVFILLMMGTMMPETCWDWFNSINVHLIIVTSVGSIIHLLTVHLTLNISVLNECDIAEPAYSGEKCIRGHNLLCGLLK
jgi:hypothetical protein